MQLLISGARRLGLSLSSEQVRQFVMYYETLAEWNQKFNLTSITGREETQTRHFLDSLTVVLALPYPAPAQFTLLDVGSGAGFPGIPLAIARPDLHVVLLEATGKKVRFLEHVVDKLGLSVAVEAGRAEDLAHTRAHRGRYDAVVARALAPLAVLVELTLPFCRKGGLVIAQKKGDISQELRDAGFAVRRLGGLMEKPAPVRLPELEEERVLVLIRKERPTPPGYPRRPGVPKKEPLLLRGSM